MTGRPQPEAELRDAAAAHLTRLGYHVEAEATSRHWKGRVDLLVADANGPFAIIEAKLSRSDIAKGIGQIIVYRSAIRPMRGVLLLPADQCDNWVRRTCAKANMLLWAFDASDAGDPFAFKASSPAPRACGCVEGFSFCPDAERAWLDAGLAHVRGDLRAYGQAVRAFSDHITPAWGAAA